jgi:hypothetical protein
VSGVEEHADLGTDERGGEIADLSLERRLVQVEAIDDLEAVRPQDRGYVGRVVPGIGQLAGVLVGRVAMTSATRLPAWAAEPMQRSTRTMAARTQMATRPP